MSTQQPHKPSLGGRHQTLHQPPYPHPPFLSPSPSLPTFTNMLPRPNCLLLLCLSRRPSMMLLDPIDVAPQWATMAVETEPPRSQGIKPGTPRERYPAKELCSRCGLCDTYLIAHVKESCAFIGDGMSKCEVHPAAISPACVSSVLGL